MRLVNVLGRLALEVRFKSMLIARPSCPMGVESSATPVGRLQLGSQVIFYLLLVCRLYLLSRPVEHLCWVVPCFGGWLTAEYAAVRCKRGSS